MESKLIKVNKSGEVKNMTFNEVVEQYNNMIKSIIPKYLNELEYDEAYQVALISLWKAYKKYDINLGYTFTTISYTLVDGYLKGQVRNKHCRFTTKCTQIKEIVSLQQAGFVGKNGDEITIEEMFGEPDINFNTVETDDLKENLLNKLNRKQRNIVETYLNLDNPNILQLSKKMGTSKFIVEKELNSAFSRLRKIYRYQFAS